MPVIKIDPRNEVVLPDSVCDELGIGPGDMVQIDIRPVFDPPETDEPLGPECRKALAEGLDDLKDGRVHGPFDNAEGLIAFLRSQPSDPGAD